MPIAAPSFLLLRFLCRHKENEVAVGQTRRFCFVFGIKSSTKRATDQRSDALSSFPTIETKLNFVSNLRRAIARRRFL